MNLFAQHAAQMVVDGLWQGTVVAITVALVLRVLPGVQAAQRFLFWCVTFALAVALPLLALHGHPASTSTVAFQVGQGWGVGLALLWLAMVTVRAVRLGAQALRVRAIWRSAQPIPPEGAVLVALQACPRSPQLCASDDVDAPSVIGFLAPRLLIPAAMLQDLTEAELLHIVLHECEHLRRHDDWLNLLQKLAVALFPLNPVLLWVDQRLGLERELACDAGVVRSTGAALDYANCLARLAEHRLGRRRVVLALSAWARRSELARRVYSLLQPVRRISRVGTGSTILTLACALCGVTNGILRVPTLVSFSSPAALTVAVEEPMLPSRITPVAFRAAPGRTRATEGAAVAHAPARHFIRTRASQRRMVQTPRLLTTYSQRRIAPAYLVPVKFSYSYAAVPFGDGWLIVQL